MEQNISMYSKAIEFTGDLSKGQKHILHHVLSFSDKKGITADVLKNLSEISRQAASIHLQRLMKRGFVYRKKDRVYKYFVNKDRLNELLEDYKIGIKIKLK
jgi:predicted transcriptional regulator